MNKSKNISLGLLEGFLGGVYAPGVMLQKYGITQGSLKEELKQGMVSSPFGVDPEAFSYKIASKIGDTLGLASHITLVPTIMSMSADYYLHKKEDLFQEDLEENLEGKLE